MEAMEHQHQARGLIISRQRRLHIEIFVSQWNSRSDGVSLSKVGVEHRDIPSSWNSNEHVRKVSLLQIIIRRGS